MKRELRLEKVRLKLEACGFSRQSFEEYEEARDNPRPYDISESHDLKYKDGILKLNHNSMFIGHDFNFDEDIELWFERHGCKITIYKGKCFDYNFFKSITKKWEKSANSLLEFWDKGFEIEKKFMAESTYYKLDGKYYGRNRHVDRDNNCPIDHGDDVVTGPIIFPIISKYWFKLSWYLTEKMLNRVGFYHDKSFSTEFGTSWRHEDRNISIWWNPGGVSINSKELSEKIDFNQWVNGHDSTTLTAFKILKLL